jgi:hypothetical protein
MPFRGWGRVDRTAEGRLTAVRKAESVSLAGSGRTPELSGVRFMVIQTRRRTATTRPMIVASSPGIGSKAGLAGISHTWPSRWR